VLDEPTISVTASKYGDSSDTRDQVVVEEHNDAAQDLLNRFVNSQIADSGLEHSLLK